MGIHSRAATRPRPGRGGVCVPCGSRATPVDMPLNFDCVRSNSATCVTRVRLEKAVEELQARLADAEARQDPKYTEAQEAQAMPPSPATPSPSPVADESVVVLRPSSRRKRRVKTGVDE